MATFPSAYFNAKLWDIKSFFFFDKKTCIKYDGKTLTVSMHNSTQAEYFSNWRLCTPKGLIVELHGVCELKGNNYLINR